MGLIVVAAMLVGALVVVLTQRTPVAERTREAVCSILNLGQGACGSSGGDDTAKRPEPTQACTVTGTSGNVQGQVSVSVVTLENGRQFQIEHLSDGTYRMTVGKGKGAGVEVGVGGGMSLTVADRTVGNQASADVGAGLSVTEGEVYDAEDEAELRDLVNAHIADAAKDELVAESGPVRWLTDKVTDGTGLTQPLPEPDETFHEGGFSVNASAQAASIGKANAGVTAAQALGFRESKDGSKTFYLASEVSGEAGLQTLGVDTEGIDFMGAGMSGSMEVVTAVTVDPDGEVSSVDATVTASGEGSGLAAAVFTGEAESGYIDTSAGRSTVFQTSLPMDSRDNQVAGWSFLASQGVKSVGGVTAAVAMPVTVPADLNYFNRVRQTGSLTQQGYDLDGSTPLAGNGGGKAGPIALAGSVDVSTETIDLTDAQYWDGSRMSDWTSCSGASAAGGD
ncbi:hypothetical protein [Janibacter alittae]|uniref:Uncharacterized protein n=1 Tax=Janibacter alittae TaxID=3115209 RepID=A0ABZ2MH78_9MICO